MHFIVFYSRTPRILHPRHGGAFRNNPPACDMLANSTSFRNQGYGSALHSLDHGLRNITQALKQRDMWKNTLFLLAAE